MGDMAVWGQGGICSLQDLMVGVGIMEKPTCRNLSCRLANEAKAGVGGAQGFALVWTAYRGDVLLAGWSLTSWSSLCNSRLVFIMF